MEFVVKTKQKKDKPSKFEEWSREAEVLYPVVQELLIYRAETGLSDADLVGLYVLCYLSVRKPNNWSNGLLPTPIVSDAIFDSVKLMELPQTVRNVLQVSFIMRKLKISEDVSNVTVMDVFNKLQIISIKGNNDCHVNKFMVMYGLKQRPVILMFHIPTSLEVLFQQSRGERVVTMLVTKEELSSCHTSLLTYMKGKIEHSRDALEFLLHDFKHMEHFVNGDIYDEQVGFFHCVVKMNSHEPQRFFLETLGHPEELWFELEYVISDMNCYSTHLLRYLHAKLLGSCLKNYLAIQRTELHYIEEKVLDSEISPSSEPKLSDLKDEYIDRFKLDMQSQWGQVLVALGMDPSMTICDERGEVNVYNISMKLNDISFRNRKDLEVFEWEAMRDYFKYHGRMVLNK